MDDGRRRSIMLTPLLSHDRMQSARFRARSSMAEHRPFKPLVESSNLSALIQILPVGGIFGCESPFRGWYSNLCEAPCGLRAHFNPPNREDFWLRVSIQGMVFESLRSTLRAPRSPQSSQPGGFLVASPHSGDGIRIFAKHPAGSALIQIILCRRVFRRSCISVRFFNYPHKYIHHFRIEVISCFRADVFQRLLRGPGAAIGAVGSQCIKNVRHCKDAGR